jgi:Ribbon-helix-helix protein, copG family
MAMKRQLFHIPQDQVDRLHAMAKQRQVSIGELVRRFIEQGLARLESPETLDTSSMLSDIQSQIDTLRDEFRVLRASIESSNKTCQ